PVHPPVQLFRHPFLELIFAVQSSPFARYNLPACPAPQCHSTIATSLLAPDADSASSILHSNTRPPCPPESIPSNQSRAPFHRPTRTLSPRTSSTLPDTP